MDRIVVTGALGFIGSHVARLLETSGFNVIRSDMIVPKGTSDVWERADLTRPEDLNHLTRETDAVCHLGGIADVYAAARQPEEAIQANATGTLNLLQASIRNGVRRLLYASTWEVYGYPQREPVDEQGYCRPTHPYSISKLAGDLLAQSFGAGGRLQTVVLRIGTAYGLGMRQNAVIPAFIDKALKGERVEIFGSGSQERQFTHVSDIAMAFHLALNIKTAYPVYNVVSPERTSIQSIAESIVSRIPTEIGHGSPRPSDAPFVRVSSELARRSLGWKAKVPFHQGLEEIISSALQSAHGVATLRDVARPKVRERVRSRTGIGSSFSGQEIDE